MRHDVRRLSFAIVSPFVVVLAVLSGCDANRSRTTVITCEKVYRVCPSVQPSNEEEAAQCADVFQGRCGAEMRQYIQCVMGKCDDAGAVDRVAAENACFATVQAYRSCDTGEREGGVGPDQGQLPPFPTDASLANDGG